MGNYFFWLTFCIFGQPACILLYYYDFVEKSKAQLLLSSAPTESILTPPMGSMQIMTESVIEQSSIVQEMTASMPESFDSLWIALKKHITIFTFVMSVNQWFACMKCKNVGHYVLCIFYVGVVVNVKICIRDLKSR